MTYHEFILVVNLGSIFYMLLLTLLLFIATRFKGENAYAAAIIVFTTIPTYLYNFCRSECWYHLALWLAPFGYSANTLVMPLLWLFVYRNYNAGFKLRPIHWLHFLPALCSILFFGVYFLNQPAECRWSFIAYENQGKDSLLGIVNALIVYVQMIVYFMIIFIFLSRVRHYVLDNFSEAEWTDKRWIRKFVRLLAFLSLAVILLYLIWPRCDAWLIQILNVIAMSYLVYQSFAEIRHPQVQLESITEKDLKQDLKRASELSSDQEKLRPYAEKVQEYLQSTQAYLNPNLSLRDVVDATGISYNNLSKAINVVLKRNFFDLINSFRVERAKSLLLDYKKRNQTIDAVAQQSGFNSRFSMNNAFKKAVGMSTSKWLDSLSRECDE